MGPSPYNTGGPGGYEMGQAYAYPQTGYMPMGMPGGSNEQRRDGDGMAYGMQRRNAGWCQLQHQPPELWKSCPRVLHARTEPNGRARRV